MGSSSNSNNNNSSLNRIGNGNGNGRCSTASSTGSSSHTVDMHMHHNWCPDSKSVTNFKWVMLGVYQALVTSPTQAAAALLVGHTGSKKQKHGVRFNDI